jgi:hypothetical protein
VLPRHGAYWAAPLLDQLHQAAISQSQVLKVDQGSISKFERRTDMYIGTLRRYIEAMGGSPQIRAVFPDGEVLIKQFEDAK